MSRIASKFLQDNIFTQFIYYLFINFANPTIFISIRANNDYWVLIELLTINISFLIY